MLCYRSIRTFYSLSELYAGSTSVGTHISSKIYKSIFSLTLTSLRRMNVDIKIKKLLLCARRNAFEYKNPSSLYEKERNLKVRLKTYLTIITIKRNPHSPVLVMSCTVSLSVCYLRSFSWATARHLPSSSKLINHHQNHLARQCFFLLPYDSRRRQKKVHTQKIHKKWDFHGIIIFWVTNE
jgi:hypothetical protein